MGFRYPAPLETRALERRTGNARIAAGRLCSLSSWPSYRRTGALSSVDMTVVMRRDSETTCPKNHPLFVHVFRLAQQSLGRTSLVSGTIRLLSIHIYSTKCGPRSKIIPRCRLFQLLSSGPQSALLTSI